MSGNLTVNANLYLKNSVWHSSIDNIYRLYFAPNEISYIVVVVVQQMDMFFIIVPMLQHSK